MKKQFRITLFKKANSVCETVAILAAKSNGNEDSPTTLAELKCVVDGKRIEYPALYGDTTAELIGNNMLCIDVKDVNGDYVQACIIEEVEIFGMVEEDKN